MNSRQLRAVLLAAPFTLLAVSAFGDEPPTVLERVQKKWAENPDMRKLATTQPEALAAVSWLTGTWDAVIKTHATKAEGEKVGKATRTTRFELGGRWIVSRNKGEGPLGEDAVELLGFDPYQRIWRWQFFSSVGRGTNAALVSTRGWDEERLTLAGTFYIWGESADVAIRLVKMSNDEYYEIFEEKLTGELVRPFLEYHYTRAKAAPAVPAPAAKPAPKPPAK
ncbi:MAG TPA: DUF1579 family protein [Thermoanaerobaculia bacterium]|nr:DUF1579 family protein [Thermoanaerobaculia bacterium]